MSEQIVGKTDNMEGISTASANLNKVVSEEVQCPICLDKFDTPRIMSCLHSFCESCLQKCVLQTEDEAPFIRCAMCNVATTLSKSGVSGLRLDFRAVRLVEALVENEKRTQKLATSDHICDACGLSGPSCNDDTNFNFCRECCQVLCQRCSAAHAGLRVAQNHSVANISDLLSGKVTIQSKAEYRMCPKHGDEKLKLFCVTCSELICHDCTLIDHSREDNHKYQFVHDYIKKIREDLTSRLAKVDQKTKEFSEILILLDKQESCISNKSREICKVIDAAVKEHETRVEVVRQQTTEEKDCYLGMQRNKLLELRNNVQRMKDLADKSLSMTKMVLENKEDVIGMASLYRNLRDAMDRTLREQFDQGQLNLVEESVKKLHYHVAPLETKVGRMVSSCPCDANSTTITFSCNRGPKDIVFTRDGKLTVLVEEFHSSYCLETLYKRTGQETFHNRYYNEYDHEYTYQSKQVNVGTTTTRTALCQTGPTVTKCCWHRWLSDLLYDNIRCFTALSHHRFVIATTDGKLYLLEDTLSDLSHGLPVKRSVHGLATDFTDTIYVADKDNRQIFILHPDGRLKNTVSTGDIAPIGIVVPHAHPENIVLSHDPATVSILDLHGKALCSIHQDSWNDVTVAADGNNVLHILWSDLSGKMTLERFSAEGVKIDTLFDKAYENCGNLVMATSTNGTTAVVTAKSHKGTIEIISDRHRMKPTNE